MKVMTYNVHSCRDMKKCNSLNRIADLICEEKPGIVCLNEIETCSPRTRFADQPKRLAESTDMLYRFGPTLKLGPFGFFGNAVLSRYPIHETRNFRLPGNREPRCCLRARLHTPKGHITVMAVHLGLNRQERIGQIADLARIVKLEQNPIILMGDFNSGTDILTPLYEVLSDTGAFFGSRPTYPYDNPTDRIDYILISRDFHCRELYSPFNDASDHLPVIADLDI